MKKLLILLGLISFPSIALAQNPTCPTRAAGDATNACASTKFVADAVSGISGPPLSQNHIFVGSAVNIATDVAMSGDCSIVAAGTIICTKTNGTSFGTMAVQNANAVAVTGGTILNISSLGVGTATPVYEARIIGAGQTTAALTDAGNKGGMLSLQDSGAAGGNGGSVLFGAEVANGSLPQAAIKSLLTDGATNGTGDLVFSTRAAAANTALTERLRLLSTGNLGLGTSTPNPLGVSSSSYGKVATIANTTAGARAVLELWTNAAPSSGQNIGQISFLSGTAPATAPAASIQSASNGTTANTGNLAFATSSTGGGLLTRQTISHTGTSSFAADTNVQTANFTDTSATTSYHPIQITRTETLSVDTQGAGNAALNVESTGNNTSGAGVIAQPVAFRAYAHQTGSGDAVGAFLVGESNSTAAYAAFGSFSTAVGNTTNSGAIAASGAVGNNSGTSKTWSAGGPWFFVAIDLAYSSYGTTNKAEVAALVRKTSTGAFDCGFCIATGGVASYAYNSPGFNVDASGNETALSNTATSDERLKNISGPYTGGIDVISKLKPIRYGWKDVTSVGPQVGLSAQNVQTVLPEAVRADGTGMLGVSDRPIVAALVNAVKEQQACLDSWKCRIFGWR